MDKLEFIDRFRIFIRYDSEGKLWSASVLPAFEGSTEYISKYNNLSSYGKTPSKAVQNLALAMEAVE